MNSIFYPVNLTEIGPDILHTPFLTEEYCSILVSLLQENNSWKKNPTDTKFSTRDIYIEKAYPDLFSIINDYLDSEVWPKVSEFWEVGDFSVDTMFAIEYTLDTQKSLKAHHDRSFITGSVKLNNEYRGAELVFPKKEFSNGDIPTGDLLIWPSNVTHLHKCTELREGKKYSLTIWTKEDY